MTSAQFQELMRHLGCLNGTKFSVIFGEEMQHGQGSTEKLAT